MGVPNNTASAKPPTAVPMRKLIVYVYFESTRSSASAKTD
jgi:hypothetical protein